MLDTLNAVVTERLGPAGPLILVAGLALVLLLACIPLLMAQRPDPMRKLAQTNAGRMQAETRQVLRETGKRDKLNRYAQFLEPQNAEELSDIRLKLMQAGYAGKEAVRLYYFAQFALGLGLLACGVGYYMATIGPEGTAKQMMMYILGPGFLGYYAPKYWVTKRQQERQQTIQDGFPDALDMMLVCVEAGQSMDQAIVRLGRELRASYPPLADEFQLVSYEMKAGKDKAAVLGDMSERCGVQDVSSFVTVLNQSAQFGTSVADALRIYAAEMRDKRVMRAEEKANKLPTKMTLTTMMLTVPPLLIILVGPSAVGIMELGSMGR
ncbi:pilus assembly protein TadC [Roseivivax halodurans JCM 10272]|uniref:Pilus assembly protein TadC n=1 Tax=Roseivivax halodurans JCM 10272 TaxID=1449350 RepID=X7EFF9_9RHOB|nr:type II secretion system F family protein [Roseivivax halodurans]ETX14819.1 pilus assembly protein TadC [Roseivivax halodurans JCM 10272]